jgi:hypothetical protein
MADARVGTTPYWFRFLEWPPEQGGAAKPAQIDTWLYIFQVHDKAARLCEEVLVKPATGTQPERYLRVDLNRHKGKTPRPPTEPGADSFWLDDELHVLENVRYYVLCSPFQLHWSRIDEMATHKDAATFDKLARKERGLRMVLLNQQNTKAGPGGKIRIKAVWSPWGQALALNREYRLRLTEWEMRAMTKERQQWRSLLAAVDMLTRGMDTKGLIDDTERKRISALLLEDDELFAKVEHAASKLVAFLQGPAMTAMELDAAATNECDHREVFAAIREAAERRLGQTRAGRKYRQQWFEDHHNLVLFDVAANVGKTARKVSKTIFTWVKSWADVAAGYPSGSKHAGEVPKIYVAYVRCQVYAFTNKVMAPDFGYLDAAYQERVRAVLTEKEFEEWQSIRYELGITEKGKPAWGSKLKGLEPMPMKFSKQSLRDLKSAVNENKIFNVFFLLVDAVNAFFTMRALFDGDGKDGGDRVKKAAVATSGLCSFLSSAIGVAKSTTSNLSTEEITRLMSVRTSDITADALLSTYEAQGPIRRVVAKASASRVLAKGLGALGAAGEAISYGTDVFHGLHEAKTGDSPDKIWIWPGLGLMGSLITGAAYVCLYATPPGAILITLGTILGMTATIGGVLWPGLVASDTDKWLMHCFVGKHRLDMIAAEEAFTKGKDLAAYHTDLDLQLSALDYVLFDFEPTCEIYEEGGEPRLKIDVRFRQLKCRSKVRLHVFGKQDGRWGQVRHKDDWRPVGKTEEDEQSGLRKERAARYLEGMAAWDFDEMKIAVQIDVLGDGTFLYPEKPKEASAKA